MKIHFVIWSLELGGAQSSLMRVTEELAHDHEVTITAFSGSGAEFFEPSAKVQYRSLGPNLSGRNAVVRFVSLLSRWLRLVRALRAPADVVVSFLNSTTLVTAPACRIARRPLIAAERTDIEHRKFRSRPLVMWTYRRFCARVVVQSDALATWLQPRIGAVPVSVVPNPMPDLSAGPATHRHGVVALGRFASVKGFDLLVEAAGMMTSGQPVDIYGSGEEGHRLRTLIERLALGDRVRLHPPTADAAEVIARAAVLAVPSHLDGFPNVILEAFAVGTPVVATITTGAMAIDGETGAVELVTRDARTFATAIDAMCVDAERAAAMVLCARARSAAFERGAIARLWTDVFEKTV